MTTAPTPGRIVDRLRANLRAAGIPFTDADIEGIVETGFLQGVMEFESLASDIYLAGAPDYLDAWGDGVEPDLPGANLVAFPHSSDGATELDRASIRKIGRLLERRDISPIELTRTALDRIRERNRTLNAFQCVVEKEALAAAQVAEREIAEGDYRGGLHGVPVAVKDLFDLAGTPTTAGSAASASGVARHDSAAVDRLRRSGAIIVGKTTLAEFAYSPARITPIMDRQGTPGTSRTTPVVPVAAPVRPWRRALSTPRSARTPVAVSAYLPRSAASWA